MNNQYQLIQETINLYNETIPTPPYSIKDPLLSSALTGIVSLQSVVAGISKHLNKKYKNRVTVCEYIIRLLEKTKSNLSSVRNASDKQKQYAEQRIQKIILEKQDLIKKYNERNIT